MSTVQNLVNRVRLVLSDPEATRWTDTQLVSIIDEAQKDICRKTKVLRESKTILAHPHQATYTLPEEVHTLTRASYEGYKLTFMSYKSMDAISNSWELSEGEPKFVIQDLSIRQLIRLNPIPVFEEPNPFNAATAPAIDIHYIKKPNTLSELTDTLELEDLYDNLIEYYVTGKLLRVDNDTQNRAFGNEQFTMYSNSLLQVFESASRDFVDDTTVYKSNYRRT